MDKATLAKLPREIAWDCRFVPNCMDLISTYVVERAVVRQMAIRPSDPTALVEGVEGSGLALPLYIVSSKAQP
jgi:hypothetical protein